jgi:hypothetical protein
MNVLDTSVVLGIINDEAGAGAGAAESPSFLLKR